MLLRFGYKGGFQVRVAIAQQHQLRAAGHQAIHRVQHQGQALLLGQTADHGEQRRVWVGVQAGLDLQGGFAAGFAQQLVVAVGVWQQRVGGGVPDGAVHAVEDAAQLGMAAAQQAVESAAVFGALYFARIGGAHGGEAVGVVQAGFHERDLAPEFQAFELEERPRQAEIGKPRGIKQALVGQVVHREHAGQQRLAAARLHQAGGHQAGVPVVAVQELGFPAGVTALGQLHRRPGQRGKAAVVVGVGLFVGVFVGVAGAVQQAGRVQHIGVHGGRAGQGAVQQPQLGAPGCVEP